MPIEISLWVCVCVSHFLEVGTTMDETRLADLIVIYSDPSIIIDGVWKLYFNYFKKILGGALLRQNPLKSCLYYCNILGTTDTDKTGHTAEGLRITFDLN